MAHDPCKDGGRPSHPRGSAGSPDGEVGTVRSGELDAHPTVGGDDEQASRLLAERLLDIAVLVAGGPGFELPGTGKLIGASLKPGPRTRGRQRDVSAREVGVDARDWFVQMWSADSVAAWLPRTVRTTRRISSATSSGSWPGMKWLLPPAMMNRPRGWACISRRPTSRRDDPGRCDIGAAGRVSLLDNPGSGGGTGWTPTPKCGRAAMPTRVGERKTCASVPPSGRKPLAMPRHPRPYAARVATRCGPPMTKARVEVAPARSPVQSGQVHDQWSVEAGQQLRGCRLEPWRAVDRPCGSSMA